MKAIPKKYCQQYCNTFSIVILTKKSDNRQYRASLHLLQPALQCRTAVQAKTGQGQTQVAAGTRLRWAAG